MMWIDSLLKRGMYAFRTRNFGYPCILTAEPTNIGRSCVVYEASQASYPIYRSAEESCPSTRASETRRSKAS